MNIWTMSQNISDKEILHKNCQMLFLRFLPYNQDTFLIDDPSQKVPFVGSTYIMFVTFFLLMSIVTLNLLVGLTVDDIQTFLDEADLKNLSLKVRNNINSIKNSTFSPQLKFVIGMEKWWSRVLPNSAFLNLVRTQTFTLLKTSGKLHIDDVVSKRRIWQIISKKTGDEMKKVKII